MKIRVSDPLALLPYQTGVLRPPLEKKAAEGNAASALDTNQRAIELGEPVPIVFGKYVDVPGTADDYGGVFISPGATKARYEDGFSIDGTSYPTGLKVTMNFVLSQGELGQIRVEDVYQRACKKGTAVVYYSANAGALYAPGNYIDYTNIWTCPNYCGTNDGTYEDMTTLWYQNTYFEGDDTWNRQVHVFIRNGIKVPRLIEGTTDSSNNMVDLALYLIRETSRVPELLIDTTAMLLAANFTATNGFSWDGVIKESANLEDWMQQMASYFLLRVSDNNGKKGFRPRLPINGNFTINTGTISWVFGFTEEHILPDGFQIEYIPLSERKPICAQMIWRQQPPNDIGFIRTTEVRIDGEAVDGPYEQFDMSQFCTRENHAVKVGAYEVARRKYVTHSLRIRVKPDSYNTTLTLGDIVRVQLRRENDPGVVSFHDYLYEVEKINKTQTGVVELDLIHFPIDALGRSILALYVAGAVGTGYTYSIGRNDYSCNDPGNAGDDTPLPDDVGENNPDEPDTDVDLPQPGSDVTNPPADAPVFPPGTIGTTNYPPSGNPTSPNPNDPFDTENPGNLAISDTSGPDRGVLPGDTLSTGTACAGQYNEWWLCPADFPLDVQNIELGGVEQQCELVSEGVAAEYIVGNEASGKRVFVRGRCPDPGSPGGYGTPTISPGLDLTQMPTVSCPSAAVPGVSGNFTASQNFLTEMNAGRYWKYYIWGNVPTLPNDINYTRYTNEIPWGINRVSIFYVNNGTGGALTGDASRFPSTGGSWPGDAPSDCTTTTATWDPYPGAVAYRLVYTPGFGTILGNFNGIPTVFGIIGGENCGGLQEKAAYTNPDNGLTSTAGNLVCWAIGTAYTAFILYAIDSNGNLTQLTRRVV